MIKTPVVTVPNTGGGNLVASRIISTVPAKLLAVMVTNTAGSIQYLQVHESATLPANGAVPKLPSVALAAGPSTTMFSFGDYGVDLDAITLCNSSTSATKTIGSADCQIVAILNG